MGTAETLLGVMLGSGIALTFIWLESMLRDKKAEIERQRQALAIAFKQMAQAGLYRICDNSVKAMNETLNGGKGGE